MRSLSLSLSPSDKYVNNKESEGGKHKFTALYPTIRSIITSAYKTILIVKGYSYRIYSNATTVHILYVSKLYCRNIITPKTQNFSTLKQAIPPKDYYVRA